MRKDIQSLRGIAVLLVLVYHAQLGILRRGFLGVDVFFVISGFLITGLINRDLNTGRFTFPRFYWRRVKRLLPAAYVVLSLTSIAASFLLTRVELRAFLFQVAGSVSFSANLLLWKQADYFAEAAELKPLLHMWSLSLEEQFYLLFPFALWVTPARFRRWVVAAAFIGSFLLCLVLVTRWPSFTFYWLPTRAWELMLGSIGALWFSEAAPRSSALSRVLGVVVLAALLVVPSISADAAHPRLDAALVCFATLGAIWVRPAVLERGLTAEVLSHVGDMSYSLYLIHWPIFCFARNVFLGEVPLVVKMGGVLAALALAELLYRYIENPIRRSNRGPSRVTISALFCFSAVIVSIPAATLVAFRPSRDWKYIRRANVGLGMGCDYGGIFEPKPECGTRDARVMIWGDSFAMHLVPGLVDTDGGLGVIQATRSACGPVLGLATTVYGEPWAHDCIQFNQSVLEFLRATPQVQYVVMSSQYEQYLPSTDRLQMVAPEGRVSVSRQDVINDLKRTIELVRATGKKVVIVAPTPSTGVDFGLCVERTQTGLPTFGEAAASHCSMDAEKSQVKRRKVVAFLQEVASAADVRIVWPSDLLCSRSSCETSRGGLPIFRDVGHLSYQGSVLLAREHRLFQRLLENAR